MVGIWENLAGPPDHPIPSHPIPISSSCSEPDPVRARVAHNCNDSGTRCLAKTRPIDHHCSRNGQHYLKETGSKKGGWRFFSIKTYKLGLQFSVETYFPNKMVIKFGKKTSKTHYLIRYPLVISHSHCIDGPFIDGLPFLKMLMFHGYVIHNQRVDPLKPQRISQVKLQESHWTMNPLDSPKLETFLSTLQIRRVCPINIPIGSKYLLRKCLGD